MLEQFNTEDLLDDYRRKKLEIFSGVDALVQGRLTQSHAEQKEQHDKNIKIYKFKVGDLVSCEFNSPLIKGPAAHKLADKYQGLWRIISISLNETHCVIKLVDDEQTTHKYHLNLVKPVNSNAIQIRKKYQVKGTSTLVAIRQKNAGYLPCIVCKFSA